MRRRLCYLATLMIIILSFVSGLKAESNPKDVDEIERLTKQLRDGKLDLEKCDRLASLLAKNNLPQNNQALRRLLLAQINTKWGGSYLFDSEYLNLFPERTAKELIPLLKDDDAKVRAYAATVLAHYGSKLNDSKRRNSPEKYGRILPDLAAESKELVENLRSNLKAKDPIVRWASAEALIATKLPITTELIPIVIAWLQEESRPAGNEAYPNRVYVPWNPLDSILNADRDRATTSIFAALPKANAAAQVRLAEAMNNLPPEVLQPKLAKALEEKDKRLRYFAITVIQKNGNWSFHDRKLIVALARQLSMLLDDADATLRLDAAELLIGGDSGARDRIVNALIRGLEEKESKFRLQSIRLLNRMGKSAPAAVPALEKRLEDSEPQVRLGASATLYGLDHSKTSSILPVILAIVTDVKSPHRLEATETLLQVDPTQTRPAVQAVQDILPKMTMTDNWRVIRVVRLLGASAKPIVPDLLRKLDTSKQDRGIPWAVTIAMIDPNANNKAADYVRQSLIGKNEQDEDNRDRVLWELRTEGKRAKVFLPELKTILKSGYVSDETIEILAAIGPDAKETLPLLRMLLQSQSDAVRRRAARAIKAIEAEENK